MPQLNRTLLFGIGMWLAGLGLATLGIASTAPGAAAEASVVALEMEIATSGFDAPLSVDSPSKSWQLYLDPPRGRLDRDDGTSCLVDLEADRHRELDPAARTFFGWPLDEEPLDGMPPPLDRAMDDLQRRGRIELRQEQEDPGRTTDWTGTFPSDPEMRIRASLEALPGVDEALLETLWRRCTALLDPVLAAWLGEVLALPGVPVRLEVERVRPQGTVTRRYVLELRDSWPVPDGGFEVPAGFREVPFDPSDHFEISYGRPPG